MTFEEQLEILKQSRQFHRKWYAQTYPEVAAQGLDPVVHYLREGARKGYNPGKFFDTAFYLSHYPDVAASGVNPLVHFETIGAAENRVANPARATATGRNAMTPSAPLAAARNRMRQDTSGLGGAVATLAGTDPAGPELPNRIRDTPRSEIAPFLPCIGTLCRLIVDLGITWQGGVAPQVHASAAGDGALSGGAAVAVLTSGGRGDALAALARAEHPQADILICAPNEVVHILPAPGPDGGAAGPKGAPIAVGIRIGLGAALAQVTHAYTHDAPTGMDALIRGIPLTVTGEPFYAGWGFTDDRASLAGRSRHLDFDAFLASLLLAPKEATHAAVPPEERLQAVTGRILGLYLQAVTQSRFDVPDLAARLGSGDDASADQDLLARLDRNAVAACAAGNWSAFLADRPRAHLTATTRRIMLEQLATGATGSGYRSLQVQRFLAALICGFALTEDRLEPVVPQIVSLLGSTEAARLMIDLARVRGMPPATVLPGWLGAAPEDAATAGPDDLMLAVMQRRPGQGPDGAVALVDWARRCRDGGQLRAARRLLTCYLLTGRCAPEALDLIFETLWQGFDTAAATETLTLAAHCWPQWRGGYFPARLAQAAMACGNERQALHALIGAVGAGAGAGAAALAQSDTFGALLERRYPGLPVATALAQTALGDTPDPLARARHLLHIGQVQAVGQLIAEHAKADADRSAEWAILHSNALALQGRLEAAQTLIAEQLDAEQAEGALAPETLFQAMRLASLTGDRGRARDLARKVRHGGIVPDDPALVRDLDFARGDFTAAMESWRADPAAVLARRHLGGRLCRSLPALVDGSGANLLVALVDTPGGDMAWVGLFARLAQTCKAHRLRITCTPRLAPALARAFPQIDFVPSARQSGPLPRTDDPGALPAAELLALFDATGWAAVEAADRVTLITDLVADLAPVPEAFDPRPCLLPDPDRVSAWRARLADTPQPRVGLAWRGGRANLPDRGLLDRMDDLTPSEMAQLVRESTAGFISLQGTAACADAARIGAACPGRLRAPADLAPDLNPDPMNDPEEMLALMHCLDVVIACDPAIRALAGAAGCRVWYPAPVPANRDWGRITQMETDYRFATATYVDAPTPGDRVGLMARLLQGIDALHSPDADAGVWMDRIEALLATEAEGSEALNHAFRRAIVDAEDALLSPRLDRDTRYWEIRARVVEKLGLRAEAALCWGQACAQDCNPDPAHLRAHWIAQAHAGQPDLAERFGAVDPATLPPEALAHVTALRNDHAANALCDEGLRLLAEGQRAAAAERFRAAVRASWLHPDHGAALERVVDRMARLGTFTNPPAPRREAALRIRAIPKLDSYVRHASALDLAAHRGQADPSTGQARSVFCAGYVFSGSGAVVDFLRQSPAVSVPGLGAGDIEPFDTELNIMRRFYGLQHLLDMPPEQLSIEHLGEFLLGPMLGLLAYPSDRYRLDLSRKRSLRGVFETLGRMPDLLDLCDLLLEAAETGQGPDSNIILTAACRVANALPARLARPGRPVVLWNNCIQGWNARVLSVLDRAMMIAVTRDPRDQYVSQFYESGDKERTHTLENFIAQTHHHQRLQAQLDQIPGLRARILSVRFEEVVTDPATRQRLLAFASIPEADLQEALHFKPMESLRNIGIHRAFPDQDAIRRIEAEFPDLLWQG